MEGLDDLAKATKQFERFRKSRVETILRYSKQSAERWTLEDGPVQQERDKVRQAVWNAKPIAWDKVEQDEFANPMGPAFIKWLNFYDVKHEVWHSPTYMLFDALLTVRQVHKFLGKERNQVGGVNPIE